MLNVKKSSPHQTGYDASVRCREDDKLGRWSFAQEVYRIASNGPSEWSVRIGIYGEWGSGKTSVLDMIESMARQDGHILVRFNPWAFTDKINLWHEFVQEIVAATPQSTLPSKKCWLQNIKKPVAPLAEWLANHSEKITSLTENKKVGTALIGLELVKRFLFSNKADLERILKDLGDKRLIILIDDLDRANGIIVPEILYAIKEIMDVGSLSFVCSFDPFVIGKLLGDYHKGFSDGLKFLDKIVDYPRWLPAPSKEGLLKLAQGDAKIYCPYVPEQSLVNVIPLLPNNPRAIRQFIRLLSLLKPQVDRHRNDELNWPIILSANVIKVRFPQLAYPLLEDETLWNNAYSINSTEKMDGDEKLNNLIFSHIDKIATDHGTQLKPEERQQIKNAMIELATRLNMWIGVCKENLAYQLHIAEVPSAVTWKEYEQFFEKMKHSITVATADTWIKDHSLIVDRSYEDIFKKLFSATVMVRKKILDKVADARIQTQMIPLQEQADTLMEILELLTFEFGNLQQPNSRVTPTDFKMTMDSLMYYVSFKNTSFYQKTRVREETYLMKFVQQWGGAIAPLIKVMDVFSASHYRELRNEDTNALYKKLADIVIPRYAEELLNRFSEEGFMEQAMSNSDYSNEIKYVLFDATGPLWQGLREKLLNILSKAENTEAIQHNAYELLLWFDYKIRKENGFKEAKEATNILKNPQIGPALWEAATAQPLNPRAIGTLRGLHSTLKALGIEVVLPQWWIRRLGDLEQEKNTSDL